MPRPPSYGLPNAYTYAYGLRLALQVTSFPPMPMPMPMPMPCLTLSTIRALLRFFLCLWPAPVPPSYYLPSYADRYAYPFTTTISPAQ